MKIVSQGKCAYCKQMIKAAQMTKHLAFCKVRAAGNSKEKHSDNILLLQARADPFFVYFEMPAKAKLEKLDEFLRDLWMECCGHLSQFEIRQERYVSEGADTFEEDENGMDVSLAKCLMLGDVFRYEYDFGTTTALEFKFVSERMGAAKKEPVILARNDLPELKCKCGQPVIDICSQCVWDGPKALLCRKCGKTHKCGEEMLLPFVNSPRAGMCGFTGARLT